MNGVTMHPNRLQGTVGKDASGYITRWMFPGGIRMLQVPPIRVEVGAVIEIRSEHDRGAAVVTLDAHRGYEYHTVGLILVPESKEQQT